MDLNEVYDNEYLQKYMKNANTELGRTIYRCRWELIQKYIKEGSLLDYGCGPNAFNDQGSDVFDRYGYDINPYSGFNKIPFRRWDIVTFWDSLEHIPNFYETIKRFDAKWLFITCPNVESVQGSITQWRHYRPEEHLFYFDRHSLKIILQALGYKIKEISFEEGALRNPQDPKAIITVVAERVDHDFRSSQ
jgi:hypothetical protein